MSSKVETQNKKMTKSWTKGNFNLNIVILNSFILNRKLMVQNLIEM